MRAYSNMPLPQFVAQLRDAAIASNASPSVIDLLDQLGETPTVADLEAEREELQGKFEGMEEARDDLREELGNLLTFVSDFPFTDEQADDPGMNRAMLAARNALERHK